MRSPRHRGGTCGASAPARAGRARAPGGRGGPAPSRPAAGRGRIVLESRPYQRGELAAARPFLVFAATDDPEVHRQLWEEAEASNILINVVDVPPLCNFIMPSILRRGDLCIAVSTGGRSPALARRIRLELEEHFPPDFRELLLRASEVREFIKERMPPGHAREAVLSTIAEPEVLELLRQGRVEEVKQRYVERLAGPPAKKADP
ncbi:MAG: siroheme synthase [Chloroflexota bacterium]